MIAWMHGVLRAKSPPTLILDVQGVGYELEAPMSTFTDLPELGELATLHCHYVVREDAHQLYGFVRQTDRDLFRMLLKVNGVGAKLGLTILSGMDANNLHRAIFESDTVTLAKLPGIGKKTAERLGMELRDRLDGTFMGEPGARLAVADMDTGLVARQDPAAEAVTALISLGLKPPEASRRVQAVDADGLVCEEIVRRALQGMVR